MICFRYTYRPETPTTRNEYHCSKKYLCDYKNSDWDPTGRAMKPEGEELPDYRPGNMPPADENMPPANENMPPAGSDENMHSQDENNNMPPAFRDHNSNKR